MQVVCSLQVYPESSCSLTYKLHLLQGKDEQIVSGLLRNIKHWAIQANSSDNPLSLMDIESASKKQLGMEARALNVDISKFLKGHSTRKDVEKKCSITLLKMLEEGLHADITIKVNGGSVKAHRCVLASISPVFNAMFEHQLREQFTSTMELPKMSVEGWQLFLVLIYILPDHAVAMEEFRGSIWKHFDELFEACCTYQVKRLESTLTDNLSVRLNPDNCWDYLHRSEAISDFCDILDYWVSRTSPYAQCRDYIFKNFSKVVESKSFILEMQTDPTNVRRFLRAICRVADVA